MNKVVLYRNKWIKYSKADTEIFVIGWADYNNNILNGDLWLKVLIHNDLTSFEKFTSLIKKLNGNFSIIINRGNNTYIATDKMRGYQINYFNKNGKWILTDDIMQLRKTENLPLDNNICEQYMVSDYVFGPHTVFKNVYAIQGGETVKIIEEKNKIERKQYFQWAPNMEKSISFNYVEEAKKQDEIFLNVFKRMIDSAPNVNNWIIPLSGGYDSRTIVNYLYKLGLKNVICYSYGIKDNIQSQISKNVAESLNFKWYFIDFSDWLDTLHQTNHIMDYLEYGFNGASAAAISGFPAVYVLKKKGIVHEGDIFVPGHALEVLAGSHLDEKMLTVDRCINVLPTLKRHFSGFGHFRKNRSTVSKRTLNIISNYRNITPQQIAECFDWKERQIKYIANTVKPYEYFGYDWRIPEWDSDLINYWSQIGFNLRFNRNMYKEIFKEFLSVKEIKDIPFANDIIEKENKNRLKALVIFLIRPLKTIAGYFGIKKKSIYINPNEGYHLILRNQKGNISDYNESVDLPNNLKKYLLAYSSKQKISFLYINSLISLLVLRILFKPLVKD